MGDVVFSQLFDVSHKSRSGRSFSLQQKEELTLQCKQALQVSAACHRPGGWEANSVETHIEIPSCLTTGNSNEVKLASASLVLFEHGCSIMLPFH
ncbi:hypothetical protein PHYPO_G00151960 [Pangasianodon hypophthalmus]|uniref:Uncharacterized protein n=1 Tax=Pangasianodon hypophthalmus TaxID=310915 RepID=A0A5N5JXQ3_PANHP|nr:hypothetical protein PHYPO_G00151960 [Pangasianodon hypophthalmus]